MYAEDPAQEFLPQAGPLLLYREPRWPGVRVDSGVVEGGEVSVHYDPMIAKVIVHAETRPAAIARAAAALRDFPILGIRTNVPYLLAVLALPAFARGEVDTRLSRSRNPGTCRRALADAGSGSGVCGGRRGVHEEDELDIANLWFQLGRFGVHGRTTPDPWDVPGAWVGAS